MSRGVDALAAYAIRDFDVLLLAVRLPDMTGLDATQCVRERERINGRPRVAIMAVTDSASPSDSKRCLEAGIDEVLTQPFDLDALQAILLRRSSRFRRLPVADAPASPS